MKGAESQGAGLGGAGCTFSTITVVYNPNSTGPSKGKAEHLIGDLRMAGILADMRLVPSEYAGHASELAYDVAKRYERPLIISSSGDGGYNELINGALRAQTEGAHPVCAVLPAGNANDHSRAVAHRPLAEAIISGQVSTIDVLRTVIRSGTEECVRYAHSYVGIGLTPTVAVELNSTDLTRIKEIGIVYKALRNLQPVEIDVDGERMMIDSLVMANISQMAKVLTIADNARPADGQFKVTVFPYRRKVQLLWMLLRAVVRGISGSSATRFAFTAVQDMVMQLDGEVQALHANDVVVVTVEAGALSTLR